MDTGTTTIRLTQQALAALDDLPRWVTKRQLLATMFGMERACHSRPPNGKPTLLILRRSQAVLRAIKRLQRVHLELKVLDVSITTIKLP